MGRYGTGERAALDLHEFEGRVYMLPVARGLTRGASSRGTAIRSE